MDDLRELVETNPDTTTVAVEFTDIENLDEALPLLQRLPHLQELSLQGNQLNVLPADLSSLATLQKLDISSNSFNSVAEVIPALTTLPNLSSLNISLDSDADLKLIIQALPGLAELNEKPTHVPTPPSRSSKHSRTVSPQHAHPIIQPHVEPSSPVPTPPAAEEKPTSPVIEPPLPPVIEQPASVEQPIEEEKPVVIEEPPPPPLELPAMDWVAQAATVEKLLRDIREVSLTTEDAKSDIETGLTPILETHAGNGVAAQREIVSLAKRLLVKCLEKEQLNSALAVIFQVEAETVEELKATFEQKLTELVPKADLEAAASTHCVLRAIHEKTLKELQAAQEALAAAQQSGQSQTDELTSARQEAAAAKERIDHLQSENTVFEQQVAGISETLARTQQERDTLETALAKEKESAAALQNSLQESERKAQTLAVELSEETKTAEGYASAIRTLEAQLEMKKTLEESSKDEQVRALKEQNENLMSQVQQLLAEKEELDRAFGEFRRTKEEERGSLLADIVKLRADLETEKTSNTTTQFGKRFGTKSLVPPETRSSRFSETESDMMHRVTSHSPTRYPRKAAHRTTDSLKNGGEKPLSLNQLVHLISTIETSKNRTQNKDTYAEHMQTVLLKTYGLKAVSAAVSARIFAAVETFKEIDCDVELFRKLLSDEVDESYVVVHETLKKQIGEQLRTWVKEKNPLKPGREIDRLYQLQTKGHVTVAQATEIVGKIFSADDLETLRLILTEFAKSVSRHSPNEMRIPYKDMVQTSLRYALQRHVDYLSPLAILFSRLDESHSGRITQTGFREVISELQLGLDEKRVLSLLRAVDPDNLQTVTFSSLVELLEAEQTSEGISFLQRLEQLRSDMVEEEAEGAQAAG